MSAALKAPFPYFGGKSKVASLIWERFGNVQNYVEPFFGSGAVLLARPQPFSGVETINDKDGFVSNFWRAIKHDPEAVAHFADWPVSENDLHARHLWLVKQREELVAKLEGDYEYFDAKIAGFWVWGMSAWIGSGFCSGVGPWKQVDGKLVNLGNAGRGINRQLPHLGDAGQGINRKLPHLGDAGQGMLDYFGALAERLRNVRICSGNWSRVIGESVTVKHGSTAVFLDPPYASDRASLYLEESFTIAHEVASWCKAQQNNEKLKICLAGYKGEHDLPGWSEIAWKAAGGFASQGKGATRGKDNAKLETLWFSPSCKLPAEQGNVFSLLKTTEQK